jgi:hypothetical protein
VPRSAASAHRGWFAGFAVAPEVRSGFRQEIAEAGVSGRSEVTRRVARLPFSSRGWWREFFACTAV